MLGQYSRTFSLDVTTKVTQLVAKNPKRTGLRVYNTGNKTVYILSKQNMTTSDGYPLIASGEYKNKTTTARLWIVASQGTQDVRVQVDSA